MSKHGVLAEDSVPLCVIVSKTVKNEIIEVRNNYGMSLSAAIRFCIDKGLASIKKYKDSKK